MECGLLLRREDAAAQVTPYPYPSPYPHSLPPTPTSPPYPLPYPIPQPFPFSLTQPIVPICRTRILPTSIYHTLLLFRPPTHFSHMSHPTFPISHPLFFFFAFSQLEQLRAEGALERVLQKMYKLEVRHAPTTPPYRPPYFPPTHTP